MFACVRPKRREDAKKAIDYDELLASGDQEHRLTELVNFTDMTA